MPLFLQRLTTTATLPTRATEHSAGLDLYADHDGEIAPGWRSLIRTGMAAAIDPWCVGTIAPRSGLALNHGVVAFSGTIDADYRGEIGVLLFNHGATAFRFRRGDRIAQLLILPMQRPVMSEVDSLPGTVRGTGGFGSTGQ